MKNGFAGGLVRTFGILMLISGLTACSSISRQTTNAFVSPLADEKRALVAPRPSFRSTTESPLTLRTTYGLETGDEDTTLVGDDTTGPGVGVEVNDPFERINRPFDAFNRGFDRVFVRPVAIVYGAILPDFAKRMVRNGIRHLGTPRDLVNHTLQGRPDQVGKTLERFLVNSVVGLGGLVDVAGRKGVAYNPTDFGLTLASYGVGEGSYFVTPFLGPSTTRDSVGRLVDIALSPTTYFGTFTDFRYAGAALGGLELISRRERNRELVDSVILASPDPYVTLRSIYVQRRRAKASGDVIGGDGAEADLPEIETVN